MDVTGFPVVAHDHVWRVTPSIGLFEWDGHTLTVGLYRRSTGWFGREKLTYVTGAISAGGDKRTLALAAQKALSDYQRHVDAVNALGTYPPKVLGDA